MPMRFHLIIKFLFLVLLPALLSNASVLEWDRTEAHVEMLPGQTEVQADYNVTNQSEETLRIAEVESSCGCTHSVIGKRILAPGESSRIRAIFNKGKRRKKTHSRLDIYLEGNTDSVATLHLVINIPELVKTQPSVIYWNKPTERSPRSVHVSLDTRYVDSIRSILYNESTVRLKRVETTNTPTEFDLVIEPIDYSRSLRETVESEAIGPDGITGKAKIHILFQP